MTYKSLGAAATAAEQGGHEMGLSKKLLRDCLAGGLLASIAATSVGPAAAAPSPIPIAGRPVMLSEAQASDHADRIETIAQEIDSAFLVASGSTGTELEVITPGASPAQGAQDLAAATDLTGAAETAVRTEASTLQDARVAMAKVGTKVTSSSAEVTSVDATRTSSGAEQVVAQVHFTRQLGDGNTWEEVTPYVATVGADGTTYSALTVQTAAESASSTGSTTPVTQTTSTSTLSRVGRAVTKSASTGTLEKRGVNLLLASSGKEAAAAYADAYWNKHNGSYEWFDNDCTNFVSQALLTGGWARVHSGSWQWYYDAHGAYAHSWTVAEDFHNFGFATGRLTDTHDRYALRRGDLLQWKAEPGWATITHTTIVTGFTTEPLLTYHSNDNHNIPLSVVITRLRDQGHSNVVWYAERT